MLRSDARNGADTDHRGRSETKELPLEVHELSLPNHCVVQYARDAMQRSRFWHHVFPVGRSQAGRLATPHSGPAEKRPGSSKGNVLSVSNQVYESCHRSWLLPSWRISSADPHRNSSCFTHPS